MKRKNAAIVLMAMSLGLAGTAHAAVDYAQLEGMTLEGLKELKAEVQNKISELSAQEAESSGGLFLEAAEGSMAFHGFVMNETNFKKNSNDENFVKTIVLNFDFTNKASEPQQSQQQFGIAAYQNGVELDSPSSSIVDSNRPEEVDNFYQTALDGGTITVGRPFIPVDESPITIVVTSYDFAANLEPAKMVLDYANLPEGDFVSAVPSESEIADVLAGMVEAAAPEAAAADEATVDKLLQGNWIIYDDKGGENAFSFSSGNFTLLQSGIQLMKGTYVINVEEQNIIISVAATDGTVTINTPYTYENGTLQIYNNAGTALVKEEGSAAGAVYTDTETVKKVQAALNEAGYDCGTPDGIAGAKTYEAMHAYQQERGLTVTDAITDELLEAMGI